MQCRGTPLYINYNLIGIKKEREIPCYKYLSDIFYAYFGTWIFNKANKHWVSFNIFLIKIENILPTIYKEAHNITIFKENIYLKKTNFLEM